MYVFGEMVLLIVSTYWQAVSKLYLGSDLKIVSSNAGILGCFWVPEQKLQATECVEAHFDSSRTQ